MKTFICILACLVIANAGLLDLSAIVGIDINLFQNQPGNTCGCWKQGAFFDGVKCWTKDICAGAPWNQHWNDECEIGGGFIGEGEFAPVDTLAMDQCKLPPHASLKLDVDLQLKEVNAKIEGKCAGINVLGVLTDAILTSETNILVESILNLRGTAGLAALLSNHNGILAGIAANLNADLALNDYNNLLIAARAKVFASTDDLALLANLKALVALVHQRRSKIYPAFTEVLLNKLWTTNITVSTALKLYTKVQLALCLVRKLSKSGGLLGGVIATLTANVNAKLSADLTPVLCLVQSLLYRLLTQDRCRTQWGLLLAVDLQLHLDLLVHIDARVNARVAVGPAYAYGSLLDVRAALKVAANVDKFALAVRAMVKDLAVVKVFLVGETAADLQLKVQAKLNHHKLALDAELQARIAEIKLAIALAARAVLSVDQAKIAVDAGAWARVDAMRAVAQTTNIIAIDLGVVIRA